MSMIGLMGLLVAFAAAIVSVACLAVGGAAARRLAAGQVGASGAAGAFSWGGQVAALLSTAALTLCCGVLVHCFMAGDVSLEYVLMQRSDASGDLAWLYHLAGLWAGREGSLLFWAWLISLFNAVVAVRNLKAQRRLDSMALLVAQVVLAAFVGVLLLSEDNMPFTAASSPYVDEAGNLTAMASMVGMNTLLEHWAMAIHPPTLFVGYAGLTIPFAYAVAALIVNDPSREWVVRAQRYALFSWLFLGIGIGLGAVWAYVVLGWGGYWGWDPVENASLLSWLVAVALVHSFTVYRQRGAFKRWSVMCACLAFAFVIVGTLITRSGIVQSVHAFAGDPVALAFFGSLIAASIASGAVGLAVRWRSFGPQGNRTDEVEHLASKDAAYYFNNLLMVAFAVLLAYLTVSSALPSWLPFGGQTVSAGTYNAICRPLGVAYLAILAVCPLLSWGRTDGARFWKRARVPGLCAAALFVLLMVYFFAYLLPAYDANAAHLRDQVAAGSATAADELAAMSPAWYYNGLAVVGFLVASVLFFNALFMLGRLVRSRRQAHGGSPLGAFFGALAHRSSSFGGFVAHLGMAVVLAGLIGSSMYVTERVGYVGYDQDADAASNDFVVKDYRLVYAGNAIEEHGNGDDVDYTVHYDVYKNGAPVGSVSPTVQLVQSTQQQKLVASVLSFPEEDLFVVYRGVNEVGAFSMDVRVNPLINVTWAGFALLMAGTLIATLGRRDAKRAAAAAGGAAAEGCETAGSGFEAGFPTERAADASAKAEGAGGTEGAAQAKADAAGAAEGAGPSALAGGRG